MKRWLRAWLLCTAFLPAVAPAPAQEKQPFTIDPARSKMELTVNREGAFKAFARDHDVVAEKISGMVQLDPAAIERSSVTLQVEAKSLRVLDPKSSDKERREIEETMQGPQVLDSARYPQIEFRSAKVAAARSAGEPTEMTLTGQLSLHGVTKTITVPLQVHWDERELHAEGQATVLQSDYGIMPVRIGGGAVKVKDAVKLSFDIVASKAGAPASR